MTNTHSTAPIHATLARVRAHALYVLSQKGNLHPDLTVSITTDRKPGSLTGSVDIVTERDGNMERVDSFVVFLLDDNLFTYSMFANSPDMQDTTEDVHHDDIRSSVQAGRTWAEAVMTDLAA